MKLGNPIIKLLVGMVVLLLGAVMGGMYTKIQYLEKGKGVNALTAAPLVAPAGNNQPAAAPAAPQAPTKVDVKVTTDDPYLGNANAKLTVVEFGDFQCPFCGRFFKDVEPQLKKDYIDTGKVKFIYKHLAFLGKESTDAANASECAREQNKFWQYHDRLFNSQNGENQGAFSLENLKKFAIDLGLNAGQFNACLDGQKYNDRISADVAEAKRLGFNGTPSTAVGDTPVIGAQPYNAFKTIIDQKLSAL